MMPPGRTFKNMSKATDAKAKYKLKRSRIDAGLCIDCGQEPAAMNATTVSLGLRGENCKKLRKKPKQETPAAARPRPPRVDGDGDLIDDLGYLNADEFIDYEAKVKGVIYSAALLDAMSRPVFCFTISPFFAPSVGDQRRILKDEFNERRHADALSHLMAYGEVRERLSGSLTRYEPAVRHERNTVEFGRQYIHGSKGTRKPDAEAFEDRRVTA
jgi:hypothetical protein